MFDDGGRRKDVGLLVHDAGPRPTREQVAVDLGGLGISSLGQRQSQVVDEGRYNRSLGGREPRLCIIKVGRSRIEVAYRVAHQVGAKGGDWRTRKRAGVGVAAGKSRRGVIGEESSKGARYLIR
jgi:hypothetical protein